MAIKKVQKNSKLANDSVLLNEIRALVQSSYQTVARYVNSSQVLLFWDIGSRVYKEILGERRADYGQKIVSTLSTQLQNEFGKGFSQRNLFRMVQFVQVFPDREKVSTLSTQLGWSHFVELITFDDGVKTQFYAEMCRIDRWSVRTLRSRISSMLFERTAISKKPENIIKQEINSLTEDDKISADLIFRDPYILDFLNIGEFYTEKDLESALIRELESFILELGAGFSFIARQKRITIDNTDYYIDLLFYNRLLKRLVVIDLKIGTFQASDKGQMELYLRWLEKHEMKTGEQPPIGLILCAGKNEEHVQLLQLSKSGIRVASYITQLPPKPVLEKILHTAFLRAQMHLECKTIEYGNENKKTFKKKVPCKNNKPDPLATNH